MGGACDRQKNINQPTLVIVGTEDAPTPAANSLIITERILGAWLVQIKWSRTCIMYEYPEQFSNIVKIFLENTNTSTP